MIENLHHHFGLHLAAGRPVDLREGILAGSGQIVLPILMPVLYIAVVFPPVGFL